MIPTFNMLIGLPEWKVFCSFIKTLPMFEELVLGGNCEKA